MDITNVITATLEVIVSIVIIYLFPILKDKLGYDGFQKTYELTKILVNSVEQTCKVTGAGKAKKNEVKEKLKSYGVIADSQQISDLIESAVHEMNAAAAKPLESEKPSESSDEAKEQND